MQRRRGVLRHLGQRDCCWPRTPRAARHCCRSTSTTGRSSPRRRSPAAALYIGSDSGKLLALDLKTRQLAWTFATDGATQNGARLTKADGTPNYEAAFSDFFYDDMVAGTTRMLETGSVLSSPVPDGDTLYFGSSDGQLYAIG